MKWLFLMFVLDTSANGLQPRLMLRQVFASEAACEQLGRSLAPDYEDNSLKSFSVCVPQWAFDEQGLKSQRLDGQ